MSKNQTQFSLVQKYPLKWSSKNKKSEKNKKCPPNGGKKRGRKVRSEKKCPPNGEKKKEGGKKKKRWAGSEGAFRALLPNKPKCNITVIVLQI